MTTLGILVKILEPTTIHVLIRNTFLTCISTLFFGLMYFVVGFNSPYFWRISFHRKRYIIPRPAVGLMIRWVQKYLIKWKELLLYQTAPFLFSLFYPSGCPMDLIYYFNFVFIFVPSYLAFFLSKSGWRYTWWN